MRASLCVSLVVVDVYVQVNNVADVKVVDAHVVNVLDVDIVDVNVSGVDVTPALGQVRQPYISVACTLHCQTIIGHFWQSAPDGVIQPDSRNCS